MIDFDCVVGNGAMGFMAVNKEDAKKVTEAADSALAEIGYGVAALGETIGFLNPDECGKDLVKALGALVSYLGKLGVALGAAREHASPQWQECLRESREHQARARLREVAGAQD